jgi:lipopolysaccharide/colanic/teichoic acid biosynthesis glycosyltransferase
MSVLNQTAATTEPQNAPPAKAQPVALVAETSPAPGVREIAKRCFDLVVAACGVALLLPVFLVITVAVLVSEGCPIFYRQTRVGRYGQPFTMLKFRTMVLDAHDRRHELSDDNQRAGPLFKLHPDPRVTRLGRFLRATSLDELPQLFNVVGGTMSMVGPRPALFEERQDFPQELLEREQLRPGITGLWQVEARSDPNFDRYRELDLEYLHSRTLWLDVKLLCRTPAAVIGEYARSSHSTARADDMRSVPVVVLASAPDASREP